MARKRLELNEENIELLAGYHCSLAEIAAVVGCSVDTLSNNYSEVIKRGREFGKCSLRRKQFDVAMNGNINMLIWLGKQYLEQRDKNYNDMNVKVDKGQLIIDLTGNLTSDSKSNDKVDG
jgi:hypothetical protein